jgi:response regulator RpfG family c-di-GMP phosphodiesterase
MRVADYVTKPFDNAQILARVQRMAAISLLRKQNQRLHDRLKQQKDAAIKAISEALKQLGQEDSAGCHKTLSSALVELVTPNQ